MRNQPEYRITNQVEFKTNPDQDKDFHILYEDSGAKYYDEGEIL